MAATRLQAVGRGMAARRRRRGEGLHDARVAEGARRGMAEGVRARVAEGQLPSAREMRTLRKAAEVEAAAAAAAAAAEVAAEAEAEAVEDVAAAVAVELRYRKEV